VLRTISTWPHANVVRLSARGSKRNAFGYLAVAVGRTCVYLHAVAVAFFGILEKAVLAKMFVYGETGWVIPKRRRSRSA
jgi:hypothetical protein